MTYRVAYLECTGSLWHEVAETLQKESGWLPVFWTGAASSANAVTQQFPGVVFQENTAAAKGQPGDWVKEAELPPLDETLLTALAYPEAMAVRMMDRMDPDGSFDYQARLRLFRRHLQMSLALLKTFRPDLAVFASAPHLIYDYTFYVLCRHLGVNTVLFVETAVNGLVFTSPSLEGAGDVPGAAFAALRTSGQPPTLSSAAEAYASRLQGDYAQAVPKYITELYSYQPTGPSTGISGEGRQTRILELVERYNKARTEAEALVARKAARSSTNNSFVSKVTAAAGLAVRKAGERLVSSLGTAKEITARALGRRLLRVLSPVDAASLDSLHEFETMLSGGRAGSTKALADAFDCTSHIYQAIESEYPLHFQSTDPTPVTYLKQHDTAPEISELSYIEYWLYRSLALRKKRELARVYTKVAVQVDLSEPFVYVPLQYQPEVSTSPLAGFYYEQELAVEQLSKTAPPGWWIYVKDHAFQFDKKGSGEMTRSLDFHHRLARMPNVRIVPLETSPFVLMDHARAVATATGTSGWEAILRGKPVLLFGHSWYLRCEGAFDARDAKNCREALATIAAGYRVEQDRVRLFIQALEQVSFRGYTIPDLAADSGVEPEQNAAGFIAALRLHQSRTFVGADSRMNS